MLIWFLFLTLFFYLGWVSYAGFDWDTHNGSLLPLADRKAIQQSFHLVLWFGKCLLILKHKTIFPNWILFILQSSKPEVVRAHDRHSPLCSQFSNSSCFSSCTAISTITDSTIDSLPEFLDHSPDSKRPSFSSHKMDVFF